MNGDAAAWMGDGALAAEVGQPATVNVFTDPSASCPCVTDHNPNVVVFNRHHVVPLSWGGPDDDDNVLLLCPTGHYTVHHLLREARRAGVHPDRLPWEVRRVAGPNLRAVAADGWEQWSS